MPAAHTEEGTAPEVTREEATGAPAPVGLTAAEVARVREDFPILTRTVRGGKPLVYLDSGATAQKPRAVLDAERDFYEHHNAAVHRGAHQLAEEATDLYESARERIGEFIGAPAQEIVFTRNGTEALNLVAYALSNCNAPGALDGVDPLVADRLRIGPGDEVCVTTLEHHANLVPWQEFCRRTGATLTWLDIDENGDLDPELSAITERTVGIQPVHLYGHPAPMDQIMQIAREHELWVFEDAAQAHGARLNGTPVGAFGHFAMFSLYPTKNMTSGEGGMVSVKDETIERNIRLYRNQGMLQQYHNEVVGLNNRMTDIHAAIGRVQLTKVDAWTRTRQENAAFLSSNITGVTTPPVAEGAVHVYHQYTIRVPQGRDEFARALKEEYSIGSGMFYPVPNHELAPFAQNAHADLPETQRAAKECLSLPVHPSVDQAGLERIVEAVNALAKAGA